MKKKSPRCHVADNAIKQCQEPHAQAASKPQKCVTPHSLAAGATAVASIYTAKRRLTLIQTGFFTCRETTIWNQLTSIITRGGADDSHRAIAHTKSLSAFLTCSCRSCVSTYLLKVGHRTVRSQYHFYLSLIHI